MLARKALYLLSHFASPFCFGYFQHSISQNICPSWVWIAICLISASWVARVTGMKNWHLAHFTFLVWLLENFKLRGSHLWILLYFFWTVLG
jgi:hypothetical protein